MEHSTADESDVAVVDVPSTSGAHWANRDRDVLQRRAGGKAVPFRRPPAASSFLGGDKTEPNNSDSGDAIAPSGRSAAAEPSGPAGGEGQEVRAVERTPTAPAEANALRLPRDAVFDPPQTGWGRTSFGVTDEPISGARPEPVSPAAPFPSAGAERSATGAEPQVAAPFPSAPEFAPALSFPTAGTLPRPASASSAPATEEVPGGIGEFVNGPGRDMPPHRGVRLEPRPQPDRPRRSRLVTAATMVLSAVFLLLAAVAGVAFFTGADRSLTSVPTLGSGTTDRKVATAPLDGRTTAGFEMIAATTKVTVRAQDLGDDLYKITSAAGSGTAPSPVLSENRVQLLLSPDGVGATGNVEVLLSTKVTWALRFVGGAAEQIVDLAGGKVSSIQVVGGSRRVDLRLSPPTGTVPVRVTGAVDELSITSPTGSPVRVKVRSGAETVAAGEKTLRDLKPGSTLTPKDWRVPNRYDVDAASRVTLLTVRTAA